MESRKRQEAKHLINSVEDRIKMQFQPYKDLKYNPNTKGGDLEGIVKSFFEDYLSSRFEFHKRAQLIDANMDYLEVFPSGGNEMDVIATFKNVTPRLFLKVGDTIYIPYDGVAFIVEVKRILDKKRLEDDLGKLRNVAKLQCYSQRFMYVDDDPSYLGRPLRILFYFEQRTNISTIEQILRDSSDFWDAMFILDNGQGRSALAINKSVPLGRAIFEVLNQAKMNTQSIPSNVHEQKLFWYEDVPFLILFNIILRSIPHYIIVDVMPTFMQIAVYAFEK